MQINLVVEQNKPKNTQIVQECYKDGLKVQKK